jgi:hypothetical protein
MHDIKQGTFDLLKELRCLDISFNSLSSLHNDSYFSNVNIYDYLPSDNSESCLATAVPSPVLKLKADNNPWNCDCYMKDLIDTILKSALTIPNLTCKGPTEYENKQWEVLKYADCSTTVAPTVIPTTVAPNLIRKPQDSVLISVTSTSDRNSAIPEDTEKPTTNNVNHLPDTASTEIWIWLLLSLTVVCILCNIYLFLRMRRMKRNYSRLTHTPNQEHGTNAYEMIQFSN